MTATCGTVCINCCGYNNFVVIPSTYYCPVGASMQCSLQGSDCNGGTAGFSANWSSSNTAIMTVNSSGLLTGVAPGTATISAQVNSYIEVTQGQVCSGFAPVCQTGKPGGSTGDNVTPTVSVSCSTNHVALGTGSPGAPSGTNSGTCTATVKPSGGTYSWTVNKNTVTLSGTTSATVTYSSSSASSSTGDTILTVQYSVNKQSASASSTGITVHQAASLTVTNGYYVSGGQTDTVSSLGSTACCNSGAVCKYDPSHTTTVSGVYVYERFYRVFDQLGTAFDSVGISETNNNESFSNLSSTCCCPNPQPQGSQGSQFGDKFSMYNPCCLNGGKCAITTTQTITVNGFSVRTESVTLTCTGVTLSPTVTRS